MKRCCLLIKTLFIYMFIKQVTNASFGDMPNNLLSTFHLSKNKFGGQLEWESIREVDESAPCSRFYP